jgi:lipoprotein NlpI
MIPRLACLFVACLTLVLLSAPLLAQEAKSPNAWFREGVSQFFEAKPKESVAAFDRLLELVPEVKPKLWQRGLALYYADDFVRGREQFEVHQTVNSADVENAAWHFLCVARLEGVEAARKSLIPIEGDSRVPMKQVHDLFAGTGTVAQVLEAAEQGEGEELRNHRCFAHLYLGLYFEALGKVDRAKEHILKAANDFSMDHYMGQCAVVHARVRGWATKKE